MKKIYALLLSVSLPIFSLSAKGSNPSAGTSHGGGGTNPASTAYVGKYKVGDFAEGGVVIYVTEDGSHGLVVAIEDASLSGNYTPAWGPTGTTTNAIYNTALPLQTPSIPYSQYYGGYQNQQIIEAITDWQTNYPAFAAAASYSKTVNGVTYSDWFLPSEAELGVMYGLKNLIEQVSIAHGGYGFGTHLVDGLQRYWSSREYNENGAWILIFADGNQKVDLKGLSPSAVRCVRAF